jgi:hypothetical protein
VKGKGKGEVEGDVWFMNETMRERSLSKAREISRRNKREWRGSISLPGRYPRSFGWWFHRISRGSAGP